jgi:hypothetical protein
VRIASSQLSGGVGHLACSCSSSCSCKDATTKDAISL